jgi:hypothetical protein
MRVQGLLVDPVTNMPLVVLRGEEGREVLPIWVGVFEANAIALQLEGIETPRPMTHDLLKTVMETLGATLAEVTVTDLHDSTFVAQAVLARPEGDVVIDCRPSDAIALALRTDAPIYAEDQVLDRTRALDPGVDDPDSLRSWLERLGEEELGKYRM